MKKKSQTESECFAENALFARKTMLSEALIFDGQRNPNVKLRLTNFTGNRVFFCVHFWHLFNESRKNYWISVKSDCFESICSIFPNKKKTSIHCKSAKNERAKKIKKKTWSKWNAPNTFCELSTKQLKIALFESSIINQKKKKFDGLK